MTTSRVFAASLTLVSALAFTTPALANCAMPIAYEATVTDNTVQVATTRNGTCPQPGGMLRQNPSTGEIVKLADFCVDLTDTNKAYVDECVPAGTYRYGYAVPFACDHGACNVDYFFETAVTTPLADTCARSAGNTAPSAASAVPWSTSQTICEYDENSCWNGCWEENTGGSGGTGTGTDDQGSSGGCSVGLPSGAVPVFGANAAALLLGLAAMRRRRARSA